MNIAGRAHLAVAPHQIDLVRGERGLGLRDNRVAGYDEAVGFVIVNKFPAGHVHRTARVLRLYICGKGALLSERGNRRQRDQWGRGEQAAQ